MKTFFVTIAANQPHGAGYFEVKAETREEARKKTVEALGVKWSFMYDSLEEVHEFDRKKHGTIG